MILSYLFTDPIRFFAIVIALIFSISFHEFAHVFTAKLLGDETGERAGRLTLNPLAHLDPFGMVAILLIGFGWGKPAPFNPYNLRYRRFGPALVALGGPLSNLSLMVVFGIILKILFPILGFGNYSIIFLEYLVVLNGVLLIFNLIPIPPLDGSHILEGILGSKFQNISNFLNTNGPRILLILIAISILFGISIFSYIIDPVINFIISLLGIPIGGI
jgi:Zn-dependent protease